MDGIYRIPIFLGQGLSLADWQQVRPKRPAACAGGLQNATSQPACWSLIATAQGTGRSPSFYSPANLTILSPSPLSCHVLDLEQKSAKLFVRRVSPRSRFGKPSAFLPFALGRIEPAAKRSQVHLILFNTTCNKVSRAKSHLLRFWWQRRKTRR